MDQMEFNYDVFNQVIGSLADAGISELHAAPGASPFVRHSGNRLLARLELPAVDDQTGQETMIGFSPMSPSAVRDFAKALITSAYMKAEDAADELAKMEKSSIDITRSIPHATRYRAHICKQRGSYSVSIRVIPGSIPNIEAVPQELINAARFSSGLILVAGMPRSGRSSTIAAIINGINHQQSRKIVTLEKPVEYLHRHGNSIVIQHEIGTDIPKFSDGLATVLNENPDVVAVDGCKEVGTYQAAFDIAESGRLVILTASGNSIAEAIGRVVSRFPDEKQNQAREQLASTLRSASCQQLVPCTVENNETVLLPAFEVMKGMTPSIRKALREGSLRDISMAIRENSISMIDALDAFRSEGYITDEEWFTRKSMLNSAEV